jgi:hypothetical protein
MDTIVPPPPPPSFDRSTKQMTPHEQFYDDNYDDGNYLEPRAATNSFETSSRPPVSQTDYYFPPPPETMVLSQSLEALPPSETRSQIVIPGNILSLTLTNLVFN